MFNNLYIRCVLHHQVTSEQIERTIFAFNEVGKDILN